MAVDPLAIPGAICRLHINPQPKVSPKSYLTHEAAVKVDFSTKEP
jgi:hypothetical protein